MNKKRKIINSLKKYGISMKKKVLLENKGTCYKEQEENLENFSCSIPND